MTYFILLMALMRVSTQLVTIIRLTRFLKLKPLFKEVSEFPDISIIMPMKGVSESTLETLNSLMGQDYPGRVELVIAVEDANDPVVKVVEEAMKLPSKIEVKLLKGLKRIGLNPKSSNVQHAIHAARFQWFYFNDADSRPEKNHLKQMMTLVDGRKDHFATALSVHHGGKDMFSKVENISSNIEITTYYMLAGEKTCPLNGGAYFLHRDLLQKIGGYEVALNTLTEDLMFSNALKKVGATCHKGRGSVKTGGEFQSFTGYLKRQVRWMLIAKCFKPHLFYLALLNMPSIWCFLWGLIRRDTNFIALGMGLLLLRVVQAFYHQVAFSLKRSDWAHAWAIVVYDLLLPVVWFKTLFTKSVNWGGNMMHVESNGDLTIK